MLPVTLGSQVACLSSLLCCAGSAYAYRNRRYVPHPVEFFCCAWLCEQCGCYSHEGFDLVAEVCRIDGGTPGTKCIVEIQSGRWDVQTQPAKLKKGNCQVHERLALRVRPCDNQVIILLRENGIISASEIGRCVLDVEIDIMAEDFPKNRWYSLDNETDDCSMRVLISWHHFDRDLVNLGSLELTPLMEQALLRDQLEAQQEGRTWAPDLIHLQPSQKLELYSKVLEGPLKVLATCGSGFTPCYVRAVQVRPRYWLWKMWESSHDATNKCPPIAVYQFTAVAVVMPIAEDRAAFYLRYYTKCGVLHTYFRRVDRDRDIWVSGLYEFIATLRGLIHDQPPDSKVTNYIRKRQLSSKPLYPPQDNVKPQPPEFTPISTTGCLLPLPTHKHPLPTNVPTQEPPLNFVNPAPTAQNYAASFPSLYTTTAPTLLPPNEIDTPAPQPAHKSSAQLQRRALTLLWHP